MRHDDFDALDIERAYDNLDKEREEAAALRARVAELEAALQEQTRLRLAEIDLHEEQEGALVEAVRAEERERLDSTGLMLAIRGELDHAYAKHGRDPWGRHEFYAILLEEVEELWAEIKADAPQERLLAELRQVAAMCFRYAETGDRYRGKHPAIPSRALTPTPEPRHD